MYKLSLLVFESIHGRAPGYIPDLMNFYTLTLPFDQVETTLYLILYMYKYNVHYGVW